MSTGTDALIETLRRGPTEGRWGWAERRFQQALLGGQGHILVTSASPHEAVVFVDIALQGFEDAVVLRVSAGGGDFIRSLATAITKALGAPAPVPADESGCEQGLARLCSTARASEQFVLVVVHDVEAAGAETVERVRLMLNIAAEDAGTLRVIVVGTPLLEDIVTSHEARAFASRIGAFIRLEPTYGSTANGTLLISRRPPPSTPAKRRTMRAVTLPLLAYMIMVAVGMLAIGDLRGKPLPGSVVVVEATHALGKAIVRMADSVLGDAENGSGAHR